MRDFIITGIVAVLLMSFVCADMGIAANQGSNVHKYNGTNAMTAHSAIEISNTPSGSIVATTVQGAIDALATAVGSFQTAAQTTITTIAALPGITNVQTALATLANYDSMFLLDMRAIPTSTLDLPLAVGTTFTDYKAFRVIYFAANNSGVALVTLKTSSTSGTFTGYSKLSKFASGDTVETDTFVVQSPASSAPIFNVGYSAKNSSPPNLGGGVTIVDITTNVGTSQTNLKFEGSFYSHEDTSYYHTYGTGSCETVRVTELSLHFNNTAQVGYVAVYGLK